MSILALVAAVSLQTPAGQKTAAPDAAAEAGWTSLFNGKDFTGTIALQAQDANSVVYYRNIRIEPLT